jgi:hypothetical protein
MNIGVYKQGVQCLPFAAHGAGPRLITTTDIRKTENSAIFAWFATDSSSTENRAKQFNSGPDALYAASECMSICAT